MTGRRMVGLSGLLPALAIIFALCALVPSAQAGFDAKARYIAADKDIRRVLFDTREALDPTDRDGGGRDLYLTRQQGVEPISLTRLHGDGPGDVLEAKASRDLRAVVFHTVASISRKDTDSARDVYLWRNGSLDAIVPKTEEGVRAVAISGEGSTVLLKTRERLTPEDADGGTDTYRWFDGELDLITLGTRRRDGTVSAALDRSGESAFLLTSEVLAAEDQDGRGLDLYRVRDGIATLVSTGPADSQSGRVRYWTASADGSEAVFTIGTPLTPDDTNGADDVYLWAEGLVERLSPDPVQPNPGEFFFLRTRHVVGRSIVVEGSGPLVPSDQDDKQDLYALRPGTAELLLPDVAGGHFSFEYASPFRNRVIVSSGARLLDEDENGKEDLYAWEWHTNELSLVTPGARGEGRLHGFVAANPSGTRVQFETEEAIDPEDRERSLDVYVAEDGGYSLLTPEDPANPTYTYGMAASPDARSAIVLTYGRFSAEDTDGEEDLYRVSLDADPQLLSAP